MLNIYDSNYVKNLFNRMSTSYERMNYITSLGFSIIWRKQFINTLKNSNQKLNVLDLLSGLGENWKLLLRKYPNSNFTGLDFSEAMINASTEKNKKLLQNRFTIDQKDILSDSIPIDNYDIITCAFGLKTFNNEQLNQLAKVVYDSLKKNGKFSFVEISVPPNKILCFFYKLYLGKIIPILGRVFLGNPSDYRMLWIYTENFKNCKEVKSIFESKGLHTTYKQYFFGCATGIVGHKQ